VIHPKQLSGDRNPIYLAIIIHMQVEQKVMHFQKGGSRTIYNLNPVGIQEPQWDQKLFSRTNAEKNYEENKGSLQ
jgi:hypothetical protein